MRRLIAIMLIALGLSGILLGRLAETVWLPAQTRTAEASLKDPGPAVVIDPGVAYVGGRDGNITITAPGDVTAIVARPDEITEYLGKNKYTRITGVPTWKTLSTKVVNPKGPTDLPDPANADIWRAPAAEASPVRLQLPDLWRADGGAEPPRPYRSILVVTNGKTAGASKIAITWKVDRPSPWAPYAYAIGAVVAVIGLILFLLDYSRGTAARNRAVAQLQEEDRRLANAAAASAAGPGTAATAVETTSADKSGTDRPEPDESEVSR